MAKYFGIKLTPQKNIMCVKEITEVNDGEFPVIVRMDTHPDDYGNGCGSLCFEKMEENPFGQWEMCEGRVSWNWNYEWCTIVFKDINQEDKEVKCEFYHKNWTEVLHHTFQKFIEIAKVTDVALLAEILYNENYDTIKKSPLSVDSGKYNNLVKCYFKFVQTYNKVVACEEVWLNTTSMLRRRITAMMEELTTHTTQITIKK